jgi:hypothetical protein
MSKSFTKVVFKKLSREKGRFKLNLLEFLILCSANANLAFINDINQLGLLFLQVVELKSNI